MVDLKVDYEALHNKIMLTSVAIMGYAVSELSDKVSDEAIMSCFERAVFHAAIARAILEILDMQMSDETEAIFDRLIEETATKMAGCFSDVHDKVMAASEAPKVQA